MNLLLDYKIVSLVSKAEVDCAVAAMVEAPRSALVSNVVWLNKRKFNDFNSSPTVLRIPLNNRISYYRIICTPTK